MRKCRICKETKPISDYYRSKNRTQSDCISCQKEKRAERRKPDDWITLFIGKPNWMKSYLYD